MQRSAFFCKRTKRSSVLLRSLQKNVAFFAFFYVLCKRMLHSFPFLRKVRKRMHCSFGFHKSPKTQKRMQKNVAFFKRTEKNGTFRAEKNAVPNPAHLTPFREDYHTVRLATSPDSLWDQGPCTLPLQLSLF